MLQSMSKSARQYLAEIGRRGGTRSRRALSTDQARAMVAAREARRAERALLRSPIGAIVTELPGFDLVRDGVRDLAARRESEAALLVSIAAPRLRLLGVRVPRPADHPEDRLYAALEARHGDAAHGAYNALIRRITSFTRAAAACAR